jgi:hypothetical protein
MIELIHNLILPGILTALVGSFSYYTVKLYLLRQKFKHIPGPPANGLIGFYFGNTLEIIVKKIKGIDLVDIFTEWY